jgi:hypothetical protein
MSEETACGYDGRTGVTFSPKHPDRPVTCKYTDPPQLGEIKCTQNGSSGKLIGVRVSIARIWSLPRRTAHRARIPRR